MTAITPMMAQWHECKKNAKGAVVLFRLGDFYEAFYDDAVLLSQELDITLTKRQETPMSGVPAHTCEAYIDRLVAKGYRVAIAEQMEDARFVKGIVKRKIVRIVTPGTVISSSLLKDKANNFIVAICSFNTLFGLAILDLTTADFRVMEFQDSKTLLDELCRLRPSEILTSEKGMPLLKELDDYFPHILHPKEEWHFDHKTASECLMKQFHVTSLDGFGLSGMVVAVSAAGALLSYVHDELSLPTLHIKEIKKESLSSCMHLDKTTQRHLELLEPLHEGQKNSSLLHLLDQTATPMGGRLLRNWITHPLLSIGEIKKRQEAVAALNASEPLFLLLKNIGDLERLIMRISTGSASPRDLMALRHSLQPIAVIKEQLAPLGATLVQEAAALLHDVFFIAKKIEAAIVEDPPLRLSDGNIIRNGFNPALDELRTLKSESQAWIARYQTHLRDSTQIKTLKVGFTQAFGYYIEVSRGQAIKMPDSFQRKQTLVNAERYITDELKDYEHKILSAEERMLAIETELFHLLRHEIAQHAEKIQNISKAISRIDCLLSFSRIAKQRRYVMPIVDESDLFEIEEGRHPVIEASLKGQTFIPNNISLNGTSERLHLITGPNMAGKSTFLRQTALIALMAQIGSFIPAKRARLGIIDKIFTRIGASDNLSRGQSTFMVEMTETANILRNATARSLVLLDEIGRGTSTYDGISIAWAVSEYLLAKGPKTLFATHYWELTELEKQIPGAVNYNVAVHESEGGIIFLHKIVRGGTDKSYGIHVARLAGLPSEVVQRASEMLLKLEKGAKSAPQAKQMMLFTE